MQGYLTIEQDGFKAVSQERANHPDVQHAIERDWAYLTEEKPVLASTKEAMELIETLSMPQGMTEEELKASLLETKNAEENKAQEPVVTVDGEEGQEPAQEAAPKRGRKVAAEKPAE